MRKLTGKGLQTLGVLAVLVSLVFFFTCPLWLEPEWLMLFIVWEIIVFFTGILLLVAGATRKRNEKKGFF